MWALDASKLLRVVLKALYGVVYELRRCEPRPIVEVPEHPQNAHLRSNVYRLDIRGG